jgi:hypothetical protein
MVIGQAQEDKGLGDAMSGKGAEKTKWRPK